jgi:hypothetical protein
MIKQRGDRMIGNRKEYQKQYYQLNKEAIKARRIKYEHEKQMWRQTAKVYADNRQYGGIKNA